MKTQACRTCGAAIYWLRNETTGKMAPIDTKRTEQGNITINEVAATYSVLSPANAATIRRAFENEYTPPLHTNHFQTCPQAKTWAKHGSAVKP